MVILPGDSYLAGWNPIRSFGFSGGFMSSRMASKTTLNWVSYFLSRSLSLRARSLWEARICLRRTKVLMISTLTRMARSLFKTLESMATPCSVNAYGGLLMPILALGLDVAICDIQFAVSSLLSRNMKSAGNLFRLRLTCSLRRPVETPYILARSRSSITLWPRRR